MSCKKTPENFVLFDNVVLHVLILFMIISGLFTFVISRLETDEINKQFKQMIDKILIPDKIKNIKKILIDTSFLGKLELFGIKEFIIIKLNITSDNEKQLIDTIFSELQNKLTDSTDIEQVLDKIIHNYQTNQHLLRESINKGIYEKMMMIIVFFIVIALLINYLNLQYCGVFWHLTIELLIIFTLVGIMEYWFFKNVASKYVPVNPDTIITKLKQTILSLVNKK